jgi:hypothetical protein
LEGEITVKTTVIRDNGHRQGSPQNWILAICITLTLYVFHFLNKQLLRENSTISNLNILSLFSVVVLSILSNGVSWTRICIVSWLFWNKGLLYSQNGFFLSQGIGLWCFMMSLWMCLEPHDCWWCSTLCI